MRFLREPGGLRVAIGGGHGDLLALLTIVGHYGSLPGLPAGIAVT
jgi:hypothetical protein